MADNDEEDEEKPFRPGIRFEKRNSELDIKLGCPDSGRFQKSDNTLMNDEEIQSMLEELKNNEKLDD